MYTLIYTLNWTINNQWLIIKELFTDQSSYIIYIKYDFKISGIFFYNIKFQSSIPIVAIRMVKYQQYYK